MTVEPAVVVTAITALFGLLGTVIRMVYMDLRKDRDDWKNLAFAAQAGQARVIKLVEDKLDIKVPPP